MQTKIEQVFDKAVAVLGTVNAANDWLDHNSATLGGTPRSVAETDEGFHRVMLHLAGISRHSFD
jgi:uncharacterized protein (DUF2384 family)